MGCCVWHNEEGPGRAAVPPSPLLAVPNVTAHPCINGRCTNFISFDVHSKGLRPKYTDSHNVQWSAQSHKQNCWQYIRLKRSYIRGLENCCRKDKLESLSPAVSVVHQSQRHSPCILLHDSMRRKNTQTNKHSQPRIYLVVWSTTFCLTDRQTDRHVENNTT